MSEPEPTPVYPFEVVSHIFADGCCVEWGASLGPGGCRFCLCCLAPNSVERVLASLEGKGRVQVVRLPGLEGRPLLPQNDPVEGGEEPHRPKAGCRLWNEDRQR